MEVVLSFVKKNDAIDNSPTGKQINSIGKQINPVGRQGNPVVVVACFLV
jgi:hypothetical protein